MQVTVLGTGAPLSMNATTGMVVQAPGCAPLLIDSCGGYELPRQLARAGISVHRLRNVILTHRHLDHIGGMPALFMYNQPLEIYATADTHEGVRGLMAAGFPEWVIHPGVRRIEVEPGERREIDGFAVTFFEVQHRVPTVAVRVEHAGRTLAFSADSVPCDAVVACAREADLFLCDALYTERDGPTLAARARALMHPTGREAGRLATAANARSLILLHLSVATDPANVLADARETFTGPCALAQDCETYQV